MTQNTNLEANFPVEHSQDVRISNPNGVSSVYSNNVGASGTAVDFSLYFLELGQTPSEQGPVSKHEIKSIVTLPLALAPALLQVVQQVIAQHLQMQPVTAEAVKKSVKK